MKVFDRQGKYSVPIIKFLSIPQTEKENELTETCIAWSQKQMIEQQHLFEIRQNMITNLTMMND